MLVVLVVSERRVNACILMLSASCDTIFKGLVTTVQVRYLLEIFCHGYAVKTLYNEAYAKFDSS